MVTFALVGLFIYVMAFLVALGVFFLVVFLMSKDEAPKWYDEFIIICGVSLGIISFMLTLQMLTERLFP